MARAEQTKGKPEQEGEVGRSADRLRRSAGLASDWLEQLRDRDEANEAIEALIRAR